MKRFTILGIILVCFAALCFGQRSPRDALRRTRSPQKIVQLTEPMLTGSIAFEDALARRKDVSLFANKPLKFTEIGQLAWASQGITESQRDLQAAAQSAGELFPIELYFATEEGLFKYRPIEHNLEQTSDQDVRNNLAALTSTSMQETVATAGCDIIVAGSIRRLVNQLRTKARTYTLLEAGQVTQNILLQAVSLDLGAIKIMDFNSQEVGRTCRISRGLEPLCIISVGYPLEQAVTEAQEGTGPRKAVLIVASENFQDVELFETKRVLDTAAIQTIIASTRIGVIRGALGNIAEANILVGQLRLENYDAIIFIGGLGAVEYVANPAALNLAREAVRQRKILAAIGTAPTILANAGVLSGIRATSFLSESNRLILAGALYTGAPTEEDRSIITASGPAASIQFGRAIADALTGR